MDYPIIHNDAELRQAYKDLKGMIPLELMLAIKARIRQYREERLHREEGKHEEQA